MSEAMKFRALIGVSDDQLFVDTLEGQDADVLTVIERIAEQATTDHLRIERMHERRKRLEIREEAARQTIQRMLEALELPRLELPTLTMTVSAGPPSVVITDEKELPDNYIRRSPDKPAIAKTLKQGIAVAGAELSNGASILRISSR